MSRTATLSTAFRFSLAVAALGLGALSLVDLGLRNPHSPNGIVSFELCAYGQQCSDIIANWDTQASLLAALSLGADYLFMVAYPAAIFFGLRLLAARATAASANTARTTLLLSWLCVPMGVADALENMALFGMLLQPETVPTWAWPASLFATVKFALLGLLLVWAAVLAWRGTRR